MAESLPLGDLAAAVSDALRGGGGLRGVVADATRRAQDRVLEGLAPQGQNSSTVPPLPRAQRQPLPQPGPDRNVVIRLGNGRRVRATIAPAVARRDDLQSLARANEENDRRAFTALDQHRDAILWLARAQDALALTLSAGADGTACRAATTQNADFDLLEARAHIQGVTNIVNSLQAAAYGQEGRLLATNNLLLAANQLFWSLLDPVLQRFGVLNAKSATVMAAVAPLGSLLSGQILLGERQTPRFISGVATFNGTNAVVLESLRGQVGEQIWPAFLRRTDVPVTVTVLDGAVKSASLFRAQVVGGTVRIGLDDERRPGAVAGLRIAWMVDTGAGVGR